MSWLTKRVQTERLRGKNKKKEAKGILLRLRAGENGAARFLSGASMANKEQKVLVRNKGENGGLA